MQALCEEFDEPHSADVRQPLSRRRRQRPGKLCYVPAEADPMSSLALSDSLKSCIYLLALKRSLKV